jgi:hypothetical protein
MHKTLERNLDNLWSTDRKVQNSAFIYVLKVTDKKVPWAYDVWDRMLENLEHKDNHNRAIAAQVLCNLAKSDPNKRMLKDLDALIAVTRDERFVTARHCMQSLWKIGAVGSEQRKELVERLSARFDECRLEKNWSLIRYDIIQSFRNVYDSSKDERVKERALELIASEQDAKYSKKYATLWRR